MALTEYHAKYLAHELTRRSPSDSVDKLSTALADAQVDLNPHQIDAALFAFRSPFSKGAILADEVGLGKTIEGGLLLAQKWAERRRRLLVIVPANLRKQWSQELQDKFHLTTAILESRTFNDAIRNGNLNPFQQDAVVLCSYQFARTKEAYVRQTAWDLVVIDEAHRLRNVYKPTNKIANAIKEAVATAPKVLLTATPLQNSLLELYGLVSVVDDSIFGDLDSFKRRFSYRSAPTPVVPSSVSPEVMAGIEIVRRLIRLKGGRLRFTDPISVEVFERRNPGITLEQTVITGAALGLLEIRGTQTVILKEPTGTVDNFTDLKRRLSTVCKRTLRRQVLEYVKYTERHALVQEFYPHADEQRLYDLVSEYLQQPTLYALPSGQRQLMTLILRKLIASSTYAISGTLDGLVKKLEAAADAASAVEAMPEEVVDDVEVIDDLSDEWDGESDEPVPVRRKLTAEELAALRAEMAQLRRFRTLAQSIIRNSKGDVLLTALRKGFARATQLGATLQPKAVIFTESRRTQAYLARVLEETEFKGKVTLFNGTNTDPDSKAIYQRWLARHAGTDRVSGSPAADMRAALVEHFRDESTILIATEAAAEGINLQFCNLVVNYDMPWNPQRVEQRIGRCHRYGQKFDVVVVNFLNKSNAADQRVYELLDEKFRLFNGVFGASDDVLGVVESGVDFEKRIAAIYQKCRTPQQISFEFDELQKELETEIAEGQRDAREKLLDNFDQEVIEKVRVQTSGALGRFNERLWRLTQHLLREHADFSDGYEFTLRRNPYPGEAIHPGPYRMGPAGAGENVYRVGHPLAQRLIQDALTQPTPCRSLHFDYTGSRRRIAILEPLIGQCGWLHCTRVTVNSVEPEDHVVLTAVLDSGLEVDPEQCQRLFDLPAESGEVEAVPEPVRDSLSRLRADTEKPLLQAVQARNGGWFDAEVTKLDGWAEDRRTSLKAALDQLDDQLKEARKAARTAGTLPEKLERQRDLKRLDGRRHEAWKDYDRAWREVEQRKEELLDEVERRMLTYVEREELFTARFSVR